MIGLAALLGTGIAGGVLLVIWGIWPVEHVQVHSPDRRLAGFGDVRARLIRASLAGASAALLTRWPVAVAAGLLFGFFATDLFSGQAQRSGPTDRTAAIASWTEMLRDTMAAAAGLEQAITTTAPLVPAPIRPEVQALLTRLQRERLVPALASFGHELADPTADLVVSALTLAASGEASELGDLLASLAAAARDSATMRLKVEAGRARTRTSVRIIVGVTVAMAGLLIVLNRGYLTPFDSATGQVILLGVFACFGCAMAWLASMGRYVAPERFLAPSSGADDPRGPGEPWA
jgi:tight adherence protein B